MGGQATVAVPVILFLSSQKWHETVTNRLPLALFFPFTLDFREYIWYMYISGVSGGHRPSVLPPILGAFPLLTPDLKFSEHSSPSLNWENAPSTRSCLRLNFVC